MDEIEDILSQLGDPVLWNDVPRERGAGQRVPDWDEPTVDIEAAREIPATLGCCRRVRKHRAPILLLPGELLGPKEEQFAPVSVELPGNIDGAADRIAAYTVPIRRFRRRCAVVEEAVCVEALMPVEVIGCPVEALRPGFRNHRDHSARASAELRLELAGQDFSL